MILIIALMILLEVKDNYIIQQIYTIKVMNSLQ